MSPNKRARRPRKIADHILWIRSGLELETTPLEVIKLVYIAHGWMLGIYKRPLSNEPAEAWYYGPVIPSVYHTFKAFGGDPIDVESQEHSDEFDQEQFRIMRDVVAAYIDFSGPQLSEVTHRTGTPWSKVYDGGKGLGSIIPNTLIKQYYRSLAFASNANQ